MTDSILSQAVAQIRASNNAPPRKAIDEQRDVLNVHRSALMLEMESNNGAVRDMRLLAAEIADAIAKRVREGAEMLQAYESATRTLADLDAEAARLMIAR